MTLRLPLLVAGLLFALPAFGDADSRLPLWQVAGKHNNVYLLASVHLLRATDYPLPEGIDFAYNDAEKLFMELDMDDFDQAGAAAIVAELGIAERGQSLAGLLGASDFAQASLLAAKAAVPLEVLSQSEPWLAAITVEQMLLTRLGFDPELGLEHQLLQRALDDGKEILGLETLREQLEILDRLPLKVQRRLLLQTLEDGAELESVMNRLLDAWRRGDTAALEKTVLADMREEPLLYRELVVMRNRDWTDQISGLLQHDDDYLVVVGALHLVGSDGVPALLKKRGYRVEQMMQSTIK